jgi:hypothetical protein
MMKHYIATGLSLPVHLLKRIDLERGDVSRSRYLLRILETQYKDQNQDHNEKRKNAQDSLDQDGTDTLLVKQSTA